MNIFPYPGDLEGSNETMSQKDSGGQKVSCGHVKVRVSGGKARNPGSVLKTPCLHRRVEGHGQVLSREAGQGINGKGWLASRTQELLGSNERRR